MDIRAIGTLFTVLLEIPLPMMHTATVRHALFLFAVFFVALVHPAATHAQESTPQPPLTRILFVFDASNSMNAFWGQRPKIESARELLLRSLEELEGQPDLELALRLYGHQSPITPGNQDCDDTKLEVPFSPSSIPAIRSTLMNVRCVGTTPIARSLQRGAEDFPPVKPGRKERAVRNVIILITDGIEACDEDPCAVSRALQAKGIVLKPFVIGVGLEEAEKYSLRCVGNFFDASTPERFEEVLRIVVNQALNSTTAQISLLTVDGKPTETDVPVTLYDQQTGQVRQHFVHTLNDRGLPDTLSVDPVYTYRVVVHTVPPSEREQVTVKAGQHNVIAMDAGTGLLDLRMGTGPPDAHTIPCIVRRSGESTTLHAQDLGTQQRYRVGTYDLEMLTLPRIHIPNVKVEQGRTTNIAIPRSGVLNIQPATPGYGAVLLKKDDRLEWVMDLDPQAERTQVRLQPGTYQVTYRSRNARRTELSMSKDVTIESGRSATISF